MNPGPGQDDKQGATRCGFVAIIGAPNAGKSTLVNRLVGAKVAIVTHKAQTTRTAIRGIAMADSCQLILVDTPGIFAPRRRLDRAMVETAWQQAGDADAVVFLVDAARLAERGKTHPTENADIAPVLAGLEQIKPPTVLVLNKIDAMARPALLALADSFQKTGQFAAIFMVSALNGDGINDLLAALCAMMPEGPWLYPPDQSADLPLRQLAAEVTREKLFLRLHEELPYASTVETESFEERKDGSVRIGQVVYVERDSQKAIVLGKAGRTIKAIGAEARAELETLLARRVHLFLFVKVRERWGDEPERYSALGLTFPKV